MKKKELKSLKKVNISHFLQTYYGVEEETAEIMSKHSHKYLSEVAKLYGIKFRRMSFENITKELIYTGQVILVVDHFGNAAPYIDPFASLEDEYQTEMDYRYISREIYDLEGEDSYDKHKGRQKTKYIKP